MIDRFNMLYTEKTGESLCQFPIIAPVPSKISGKYKMLITELYTKGQRLA